MAYIKVTGTVPCILAFALWILGLWKLIELIFNNK